MAGSDSLDGGLGDDTLLGGTGDDVYVLDSSGDVVLENADDGVDTVQTTVSYTLADQLENLQLLDDAAADPAIGSLDGTGNSLDNRIDGNDGANRLGGLEGQDAIAGRGGEDALDGGTGTDSLDGGAGNDTLDGGAGLDTLLGGSGDDLYIVDGATTFFTPPLFDVCNVGSGDEAPGLVLEYSADVVLENADEGDDAIHSSVSLVLPEHVEQLALTGADNLDAVGNADANVIDGNAGNNRIDGGQGADQMAGGQGDDTYFVDAFGDDVVEQTDAGIDSVRIAVDGYTLGDNLEHLDLLGTVATGFGNALDNRIRGNTQDNAIDGGAGNDLLSGAGGNDTLWGGSGDDRYVFAAGLGQDIAVDEGGDNDAVQMNGPLTLSDITLTRQGDDVLLGLKNGTDQLRLKDWFIPEHRIESMLFCDGSRLDAAAIEHAANNQAPLATDDSAALQEDATPVATGNVLSNDSDPNTGDHLSVTDPGSYPGTYGTLTLAGDGAFSYALDNETTAVQSLAQGRSLTESFSYSVQDDEPISPLAGTATLTLTIDGVNDAPVAGNDAADAQEDIALSVDGNVLANDSDVDAGTLLTVSAPGDFTGSYGALSLAQDGAYRYVLDHAAAATQALRGDETVAEMFDYAAGDGLAVTPGSLTITVSGDNDAPAAVDDGAVLAEDAASAATGNVLVNDSDVDRGTILHINNAGVLAGVYGSLALGEDGAFAYTLNNDLAAVQALAHGQSLTDIFSYSVQDDDAVAPLAADATLTLTIDGVNDAPVAGNDAAGVQEDIALSVDGNVLNNDSDADAGTVLTVSAPGDFTGSYGTLSLAQDGAYRYLLDNAAAATQALRGDETVVEVFDYAAGDGLAATPGSLTITVSGDNDAPLAVDDSATLLEDTAAATTGNVLTNDSDMDRNTALRVSNPGLLTGVYGALSLMEDGSYAYSLANASTAVQSLAAGQTATERFVYAVVDDDAVNPLAAGAALDVTVQGLNDAPTVITPLSDQNGREGAAFAMTLAGDSFADVDQGDALTLSLQLATGAPLPAWLGFDAASGVLAGTPGMADSGAYPLAVTATDRGGLSVSDVLVLTIADVPQGLTLQGTPRSEVLSGSEYDDRLDGMGGNDRLFGKGGHDTLDGGSGSDTLVGGVGNDVYYVDGRGGDDEDKHDGHPGKNDHRRHADGDKHGGKEGYGAGDSVLESAGEGYDQVYATATFTLPDHVEALRLLGSSDLAGSGNRADNVLIGQAGDNRLQGGGGVDLLQGAAGNDRISDSEGRGLFDGGAGNDRLSHGGSGALLIGGQGNDDLNSGSGRNVISYNRGDDQDTLSCTDGRNDTLSLGGGIGAADLSFRQSKNDLVLDLGQSDRLVFEDWYAKSSAQGILNLQVLSATMAGDVAGSANPLWDDRVEVFDFAGLVKTFDAARAISPRLSNWTPSESVLARFHVDGSDHAAWGGAPAYRYGMDGNLDGIDAAEALAIVGAPGFGQQMQAMHPL
ncbi:MAG: tandem-95 repeat protein [Methylococcaceae bacterium]|nr:MAG: tandem-95 repeat protein [Methylococcaceae bacterium]